MARITISLPDNLKTQLDENAQALHVSVSELVQHALNRFFAPPAEPEQPANQPPAPGPQPQDPAMLQRMQALEKYVAAMSYESEAMRQGLFGVAAYFQQNLFLNIPCPPPIEPPPWPNTPPPWMHFKFK